VVVAGCRARRAGSDKLCCYPARAGRHGSVSRGPGKSCAEVDGRPFQLMVGADRHDHHEGDRYRRPLTRRTAAGLSSLLSGIELIGSIERSAESARIDMTQTDPLFTVGSVRFQACEPYG
jgi:hypothetical protein